MSANLYNHLLDHDEVEIKLSMDFTYYVVEPLTHRILAKSMMTLKDAMSWCKSNDLSVTFNF